MDYIQGWVEFIYPNGFDGIEIAEDGSFELPEENMDMLYDGWNKLGLIEGLKGEQLYYTVYNLTMMYVWLIKAKPKDTYCVDIDLETVIFAIIRCSYLKEKITNPKKLWEFIHDWMREHCDLFDRWKAMPNFDAEARFCRVLADTIHEIVHNEKNDY